MEEEWEVSRSSGSCSRERLLRVSSRFLGGGGEEEEGRGGEEEREGEGGEEVGGGGLGLGHLLGR